MVNSSSTSQNDLDALAKDDLNALIVSATIRRDMLELQERFPAHLASRIRVRQPNERSISSQEDGIYDCSCDMFESKVFLSVLINSENEEPITRDLTLGCVHWSAFHRYGFWRRTF